MNKNLAKDVIFYSIINLLEKVSPLIILQLSYFLFGTNITGRFSYAVSISAVLIPLLTFQINRYSELVYLSKKSGTYWRQYQSETFSFVFLLCSVFSLIFFNFLSIELVILILFIPFNLSRDIILGKLRLDRNKKAFTQLTLVTLILRGVVFLILFELGINNLMVLIFAVSLPSSLIVIHDFVTNKYILSFKKRIINKKVVLFCIPFIPYMLSGTIQNQLDKILIGNILNAEKLGIYSLLLSFATPMKFLSNSFVQAWAPNYYDNEVGTTKKFLWSYTWILISSGTVITGISFLIIKRLYDQEIQSILFLLPIFIIGYIFRALKQIYVPILIKHKKTVILYKEAIVTISSGSICGFLLVYYFNLDLFGAALTFLISQFSSFAIYINYNGSNPDQSK